jgi:hypothetical protein
VIFHLGSFAQPDQARRLRSVEHRNTIKAATQGGVASKARVDP